MDDIVEEQKDRHTLSKRKAIPLPTLRANPETSPSGALHEPETTVMAIYPQTTCFYNGVIKDQPAAPSDDYEVLLWSCRANFSVIEVAWSPHTGLLFHTTS